MAKEKDEKDVTEVPYFAYGESGGGGVGRGGRPREREREILWKGGRRFVYHWPERCHPTMRRTKRGRKAQVSREGGKGEWGGGEGEFYRLS